MINKSNVSVRMTDDLKSMILSFAQKEGISLSDAIRLLIYLGIAAIEGKKLDVEQTKRIIKS